MADGYLSYCRQVHEAGDGGEDIAAIFKRIGGTERRRLCRPPAPERRSRAALTPVRLRPPAPERRSRRRG